MATTTATTGASSLVSTLEHLGVDAAFGVPGIHALSIWDAMRDSSIRAYWLRTELSAGFAADGYARSSGRPGVLLVSTGPGALVSTCALLEAASAHVPVIAISSQIPRDLMGKGSGYLHELADQRAVFESIVKWTATARTAEEVPMVLAEAWRRATSAPSGPVFVEVPVDVLRGPAPSLDLGRLAIEPAPLVVPHAGELDEVVRLLRAAERPVVWAGGGVLRSGAEAELVALAEALRIPVATTFMGKGAIPSSHPLAVGSAVDEAAFQELLGTADLVLAVGTELGAETTAQYGLVLQGRLVQIDAAPERIGTTYPALGLVGDARATLTALLGRLDERRIADGVAEARVAAVRERIATGLEAQDRGTERALLEALRTSLPIDAVRAFDMTILGYWAAPFLELEEPRRFLYPLGSGTLGYAWPAAMGARVALPDTVSIAVHGDGGVQYCIAELASARQHGIDAKLVIVDDERYGILREYQTADFGRDTATELGVDLPTIVGGLGVASRTVAPEDLASGLEWALDVDGPAVVHVPTTISTWEPTT